ncbi:hypothetical protein Ndes2526B_g03592 [Nannochloris sp. 'desiccata']|nr:putative Altered inheritance rate of mitochondria protein 25 [Chlorella desiccata (nom. nud.)]
MRRLGRLAGHLRPLLEQQLERNLITRSESVPSFNRALHVNSSDFNLKSSYPPTATLCNFSSEYQRHLYRSYATTNKRTAVKRLSRASQRIVPTPRESEVVQVSPQGTRSDVAEVSDVVDHSALVITRGIEWGTVLLGFEQANRYTVYNGSGDVVAHLLEEEGSIGKAIGRQLLRTRRPFTATVLNPSGDQIIFRLRRPAYLISSTIYIEDGEGNRLGEVQQSWHLWRRRYDLFLNQKQFAAVDAPLLGWEFELKDSHGDTLALIDRNFSGFGKEIFTDAGRYVLHFGGSPQEAAEQIHTAVEAAHPNRPAPPVTALAGLRTDAVVIPTTIGNQLAVSRPLQLDERMVALALAVSIDYDFFSRHSYGGGALSPFVHPPIIPFPMGGMGGGDGAEDNGEEDSGEGEHSGEQVRAAGVGSGGGDAMPPSGGTGNGADPLERNLGGDEWGEQPSEESSGGDWGWGDDNDNDGDGGGTLSDVLGSFGWGDDD